MKEIYCENCKQQVKPEDTFDLCLFIILLCVFPFAIAYFIYTLGKEKCPICKIKFKKLKNK